MRQFPFSQQAPATRYFLAARLTYSRRIWVRFTTDMRQETLFRGLIDCSGALGFVPWVLVFDNMKTVTTGRDDGKSIDGAQCHPAGALRGDAVDVQERCLLERQRLRQGIDVVDRCDVELRETRAVDGLCSALSIQADVVGAAPTLATGPPPQ